MLADPESWFWTLREGGGVDKAYLQINHKIKKLRIWHHYTFLSALKQTCLDTVAHILFYYRKCANF